MPVCLSKQPAAESADARIRLHQQQLLAQQQQQMRAAEKALNMPTPPAATPVSEEGIKPLPVTTGEGRCMASGCGVLRLHALSVFKPLPVLARI